MFRVFVLLATLALTQAVFAPYGGAHLSPAIVGQDSNILRSYGNLGQISTHSKSIDTPFSSVRKSDVRVSNPGIYGGYAHAPIGLAHAAYAHPAAPIAHAGLLGVAYSASPAVAHMTYSNGFGINYAW